MATNTFLNIEPIKGESVDTAHADWTEVEAFSFGVSQPSSGASGTGGLSAASPDFESLCITKSVNKASVDLNMYCAQGTHIAKLELEICQESGEKICYWRYEMENVMVQSVVINGSGSEKPTETVCFVYDKVTFEYVPVKNDGTADTKVGPKFWNLQTNEAG